MFFLLLDNFLFFFFLYRFWPVNNQHPEPLLGTAAVWLTVVFSRLWPQSSSKVFFPVYAWNISKCCHYHCLCYRSLSEFEKGNLPQPQFPGLIAVMLTQWENMVLPLVLLNSVNYNWTPVPLSCHLKVKLQPGAWRGQREGRSRQVRPLRPQRGTPRPRWAEPNHKEELQQGVKGPWRMAQRHPGLDGACAARCQHDGWPRPREPGSRKRWQGSKQRSYR